MPFARAGDLIVHYDVAGPAHAPAVVLVNSLGTNLHLWDPQLPALVARWRVIRYDMRGHGRTSSGSDREYTIAMLSDDLAALLDALAIERASVVGLSIGGVVAQQCAADHTDRVDRLVLCATGSRIGSAAMWNERIDVVTREGMGAVVDATLQRWFAADTRERDPILVDGFGQMLARTPVAGYAACCAALRDADLTAADARIAAPTLVVAGEADVVTPPSTGEALAAVISGAELAVVPAAAHIINADQPARFNELLTAFLSARAPAGAAVETGSAR